MKPPYAHWAESAVIVLGIVSLWPWILGVRHVGYTIGLVAVLMALALVAARRVLRIRRAFRSVEDRRPVEEAEEEPARRTGE